MVKLYSLIMLECGSRKRQVRACAGYNYFKHQLRPRYPSMTVNKLGSRKKQTYAAQSGSGPFPPIILSYVTRTGTTHQKYKHIMP